jgi:acetyltransferase-like isoleucine patch superfamily enzyme
MGPGKKKVRIHKTAIVSRAAKIGEGTVVWAFAQVMDGAVIGKNCVLGNGVYIDRNVRIGDGVKIHNKACVYDGVIIGDNCFIGPHVCFTNDKYPSHDKTRDLKGISWRVGVGASIGANSTVLPDVNIGKGAFIGAGSVVTRDVPDGVVALGNPARVVKKVNKGKMKDRVK